MSVPEGLCPEPIQLINLPREEILLGLADAVARMQSLGICNLMIYYAGHAFRRSWGWSTRAVTTEDKVFRLESSVQSAIRQAGLRDCQVVYFIDACQDFEDDEPLSSGESTEPEQQEDPMQYFAYSVEPGKPSVDNGLFATMLAYCLTCRVQTLSMLLQNLENLVLQLSFWRQVPYVPELRNSSNIHLFPRAGGEEIMTVEQAPRFKSTFFLSRYLARLASDELLKARSDLRNEVDNIFSDAFLDHQHKHTKRTVAMLSEIADQFEVKRDLFSSWAELVLIVECPCDDLEFFLVELQKVEALPTWAPASEPNNLPQSIRDCVVDAVRRMVLLLKNKRLRNSAGHALMAKNVPQEIRDNLVTSLKETVTDDNDTPRSDEDDEWRRATHESDPTVRAPTLVTDAAELVLELMTWFTEYEGSPVETSDGKKKWTFALVAEQAEIPPLPESKLGKTAKIINEKCEVFKAEYRVCLAPGSLWIIIRSSEKELPIPEFVKGLAEWNQQWEEIPAVWRAMQKLIRVPINAVPRRLLRLVCQVEKKLLDSSRCLWLRGSDVQDLAAKAINKQTSHDHQLDPSQVLVFEGNSNAESHSWPLACNSIWLYLLIFLILLHSL